jgi:hypothetical protein
LAASSWQLAKAQLGATVDLSPTIKGCLLVAIC